MEECIRPDFKKYIPSLIDKTLLMFGEEGILYSKNSSDIRSRLVWVYFYYSGFIL